MTAITPTERRELRTVVRTQFKVLRAEIEQRKAELLAQANEKIRHRYREDDKKLDDLNWRISQVADQATKDIEDLVKAAGIDDLKLAFGRSIRISAPVLGRQQEDRQNLRLALSSGIDAQAKQALLTLERQEADLLGQLAMGALATDEAKAFLARIPTVGELVPASRLQEIEAAFDQGATS